MMVYTNQRSKKPKKMTAKQRELQAEWEQMLKKHEPKKSSKMPLKHEIVDPVVRSQHIRKNAELRSLNDWVTGATTVKQTQKYTGTAIVGIATMHKSNGVPIFNAEAAKDVASMRR